jgi:hypothetical protein
VSDVPVPMNNKPTVSEFDPDELLYRRVLPEHFVDGFLIAAHFSFPEPTSETGGPSFTRSKFCTPDHITHPNCGGSEPRSQWRILQCNASAVPTPISSDDGRVFEFEPKHVPKQTCYAHAEVWCSCVGASSSGPELPPKNVRKKFRVQLSKVLSEVQQPAH